MVKPPNPSLPRFHAQPVQAGSLHSEKADSPSPPSPLEPASLAQTDGASTTVKVISAIALVPLLYCIRAYLLTPVAHWIGHGLVNTFNNQPSVVTAAGQGLHSLGKRELEKGSGEFIAFACLIPILVILSGIFAGLTLGYMSLDLVNLSILASSGNPTQQAYAKAIIPVRKNGHQLLTTLLLVNMIVNETLPVIADPVLGGGVQAVIVSTVLIIIFAEIIPQSICSRYGLLVGAKAAPVTQILIYCMYPIAKPVSLLLEKILGQHNGVVYRKAELRELLNLHSMAGHHGGDLLGTTVHYAQGALDLQDKTVFEHCTKLEDVFMLEDTTKLDYEVLSRVVQSGHSRIPVYKNVEIPDLAAIGKTKTIKKILGTMLVKNCVLLDPEDATPIMSIPMSTLLTTVPQDQSLLDMIQIFRAGRSHMALVSRRKRGPTTPTAGDEPDAESIIGTAALGLRERIRRKLAGSDTSDSSDDEDIEMGVVDDAAKQDKKKTKGDLRREKHAQQAKEDETRRKEAKKEGQGVPGDAFLQPETLDKLMGDIEGETIGIITLEDVIEELIGDEIEDEYDQHDESGNAVHAFVPEEAKAFVAKANLDRARLADKKARAQTLPAASTTTVDKSKAGSTAATPEPGTHKTPKTVAGAFVSKMGGLGMGMRRSSSAPGKKRTAEEQVDFDSVGTKGPSGAGTPTDVGGETMRHIGEDEKVIPTSTTAETTEIGSDEEKHPHVPVAVTGTTAGDPTKPVVTSPTPPNQAAATLPTPAMLAEALERGRKRGPPGTLLLPANAGGVTKSAAGSGASTPVSAVANAPQQKKRTFKSTPTTPGVGGPLKQTSYPFTAPSTQAGGGVGGGATSPLTEEPKNI